jgi:cardiolipin synthase
MAEKSIVMVTPYFAPKPWLIKALSKAVLRGVSVDILMPLNSDIRLVDVSNHMFAHILSKYGVKFFLAKQMNHAKALLIDDKEGLVGSNNLDTQSFDFNIEASLSFKRKDMVEDLRLITEEWKKDAIIFDGSTYQDNWFYRPVEYLIEKIAQHFF